MNNQFKQYQYQDKFANYQNFDSNANTYIYKKLLNQTQFPFIIRGIKLPTKKYDHIDITFFNQIYGQADYYDSTNKFSHTAKIRLFDPQKQNIQLPPQTKAIQQQFTQQQKLLPSKGTIIFTSKNGLIVDGNKYNLFKIYPVSSLTSPGNLYVNDNGSYRIPYENGNWNIISFTKQNNYWSIEVSVNNTKNNIIHDTYSGLWLFEDAQIISYIQSGGKKKNYKQKYDKYTKKHNILIEKILKSQ